MIQAAMLQLIQNAGEGVLVLVDGLTEAELARSRLTRAEVQRQLTLLADTLDRLPASVQSRMPEIDWAGWRELSRQFQRAGEAGASALWFAATALVPATLSWLRMYRHSEPQLFDYRPAA